jgi:hypothetical protein
MQFVRVKRGGPTPSRLRVDPGSAAHHYVLRCAPGNVGGSTIRSNCTLVYRNPAQNR